MSDCEFSGIFDLSSSPPHDFEQFTPGAVWSFSRTSFQYALLEIILSREANCEGTEHVNRCVESSIAFTDIDFGINVFWQVVAHRIVLDSVTEFQNGLFNRHLAFAADMVIRNSALAAIWTAGCTPTTCHSSDNLHLFANPVFNPLLGDGHLNKHFLSAKSSFNVSDTQFFDDFKDDGSPWPPLLVNLHGGVINGSEPTYLVRNVTTPRFRQSITVCPWAQPAIVNDTNGIFCKKCPAGQMPDFQFRKCIDCAGSCEAFTCLPGSRWTGSGCEECSDGVVFNGTECSCPTGMIELKNDAALQRGVRTCVTPADTCVSGAVIGSFCLDLVNGIVLAVGVVSLVVAVISVVMLRRARGRRSQYQPIAE